MGITYGKITYLTSKKMTSGSSGLPISPDKRGHNAPTHRVLVQDIDVVKNFFIEFPKYKSHYSTNNKLYFDPNLTVKKIFELFRHKHPEIKVSDFILRREFQKLNFSFYKPKKDTCSKCDEYKAKIKGSLNESDKEGLISSHLLHLSNAKNARNKLKVAEGLSKSADSSTLTFTFDLEKTQPIPYINTSVAYYKRQIWLYNLGINTRNDNKGHMFLWSEVEGKRGSVEVASCLNTFLENVDICKYTKIHSFSDCCGGQNRNRNIVSYMRYICSTTPILEWRHTFLESGHTYLPNDTDFGKIEKKKNKEEGIYDFNQWVNLIKSCNFETILMKSKFKDFSILSNHLNFSGSSSSGSKLKWREIRDLRVESHSDKLYFSYSHEPSAPVHDITIGADLPQVDELQQLYQNGIKLSAEKVKDINFLLKYIPNIYADNIKKMIQNSGESVIDCHPDILDED